MVSTTFYFNITVPNGLYLYRIVREKLDIKFTIKQDNTVAYLSGACLEICDIPSFKRFFLMI